MRGRHPWLKEAVAGVFCRWLGIRVRLAPTMTVLRLFGSSLVITQQICRTILFLGDLAKLVPPVGVDPDGSCKIADAITLCHVHQTRFRNIARSVRSWAVCVLRRSAAREVIANNLIASARKLEYFWKQSNSGGTVSQPASKHLASEQANRFLESASTRGDT